jgi:hypothetical protein
MTELTGNDLKRVSTAFKEWTGLSLADTANRLGKSKRELYETLYGSRDGLRELKNKGINMEQVVNFPDFLNNPKQTIDFLKTQNEATNPEFFRKRGDPGDVGISDETQTIAPTEARSLFSRASDQLLELKDEDFRGNIKASQLLDNYGDILNNEYLKGKIDLEEYNNLLEKTKQRKAKEVIQAGDKNVLFKTVALKTPVPKIKSQRASN